MLDSIVRIDPAKGKMVCDLYFCCRNRNTSENNRTTWTYTIIQCVTCSNKYLWSVNIQFEWIQHACGNKLISTEGQHTFKCQISAIFLARIILFSFKMLCFYSWFFKLWFCFFPHSYWNIQPCQRRCITMWLPR